LGLISRNKPFSSESLYALSRGFAVRIKRSFKGIGVSPLLDLDYTPKMVGFSYMPLDICKHVNSLNPFINKGLMDFFESYWTL
jgi:hypothetical protein